MSTSSLLAFFKNDSLLKLGILAVMLILLYDSLWAEKPSAPPATTPTVITTPLPTPDQTAVGVPTYFCVEWVYTNEEGESQSIFICETE